MKPPCGGQGTEEHFAQAVAAWNVPFTAADSSHAEIERALSQQAPLMEYLNAEEHRSTEQISEFVALTQNFEHSFPTFKPISEAEEAHYWTTVPGFWANSSGVALSGVEKPALWYPAFIEPCLP
eukprot:TRINITY_DN50601_c0_g1_i1.p1 TRINITY_DN50601_c0_g1~~TRINITY_DN50601_c0_g1_i1.p1  ORF type:complete len:124 (+),score=13.11 TRINITY_DN50601_c0_g1_i1:193-564(+)